MKNLICWLRGHKRGETFSRTGYIYYDQIGDTHWHIKCKRCGYSFDYHSPMARLIGIETLNGFDGN